METDRGGPVHGTAGTWLQGLSGQFPDLAQKLLYLGQASTGRRGLCLPDFSLSTASSSSCTDFVPQGRVEDASGGVGAGGTTSILRSPGGQPLLPPASHFSRLLFLPRCQRRALPAKPPAAYPVLGRGAGTKGHAGDPQPHAEDSGAPRPPTVCLSQPGHAARDTHTQAAHAETQACRRGDQPLLASLYRTTHLSRAASLLPLHNLSSTEALNFFRLKVIRLCKTL